MKNLTTKDIQNVSLEIMKEIHSFCVENKIRYSLDGGSILGAVRHNGFIPWDDDLDVMMPRPDYEKFIRTFKSSRGYKVFAPELGNSKVAYARVCEMQKTREVPIAPWAPEPTGVIVDIMPADGVYDDYEKTVELTKKAQHYMFWATQKRSLYQSYNASSQTGLKLFLKKLVAALYLGNPLEKQLKTIKTIKFGATKHWGELAYIAYQPRINFKVRYQRMELWDNLILHKFEDSEFYIYAEYDEFLTKLYGDYMTLPPVEKRVGCGSGISTYWL